jgi:uncharacterized membrane protein (DUF485 family)
MSDKVMNTVSYAGAGASVIAGLTLTEWGIIVGIVTAVLTFAANIIYQHRKDKRETLLHEAQLRAIREEDEQD